MFSCGVKILTLDITVRGCNTCNCPFSKIGDQLIQITIDNREAPGPCQGGLNIQNPVKTN